MTDHRENILAELVRAGTPEQVELAAAKLRVLREENAPEEKQSPGLEPPC